MKRQAYVLLKPSKEYDSQGLLIFNLSLVDLETGEAIESIQVSSGAPGKQNLRTYYDRKSKPGNMEPIPEAVYGIGKPEFYNGSFDWADSWGPGLGDLWVSIIVLDQPVIRDAFGFHLDENRRWAPGSAGCIVFWTKADAEKFVRWLEVFGVDRLFVYYNLGNVFPPKPKKPVKPVANAVLWLNGPNGASLQVKETLEAGTYDLFGEGDGLSVKLVPR